MNDLFVDASESNSEKKVENNKESINDNKFTKIDLLEDTGLGVGTEDTSEVDFDDIDIGEELRKKYAELFADDDNAEF